MKATEGMDSEDDDRMERGKDGREVKEARGQVQFRSRLWLNGAAPSNT